MMNGIIVIDKEPGFTSHDVVAKMRGICGQRKIGHTGTLDPMATGVLPVCLGSATKLCDMLAEHKETPDAGPLALSKGAVKCVLKSCGVSDSHVERFDGKYDDAFGADTALTTQNLVDPKHIQVCTPNVTIQVDPERSDLVETRIINGTKYILIRADEGVEVNGISVHID